jgi:hypothetical protein
MAIGPSRISSFHLTPLGDVDMLAKLRERAKYSKTSHEGLHTKHYGGSRSNAFPPTGAYDIRHSKSSFVLRTLKESLLPLATAHVGGQPAQPHRLRARGRSRARVRIPVKMTGDSGRT